MRIFLSVMCILFALTTLKSVLRLVRVKKFLLADYDNRENKIKNRISIIIPVMDEVDNIEKSIVYFSNLKELCDVYYVTTSKENPPNTYAKIEGLLNKENKDNIFLVNCPNNEGTMATQLNFVAKILPQNSIIGIYNVDSFPKEETFFYVSKNIKEGTALQQVSYFNDDHKFIMASAQNWQNRWSIVYELGKYSSKFKWFNFKYTIGHGFFIIKKDLEKIGYWSDAEINEDNELGFRLMCNNLELKPIPYLEKAGFAKNLKIYVKQQSTWFNGPLYAFKYYKNARHKNLYFLCLAILNFKAAVSWLLFPMLFLTSLALAIAFCWQLSIFIGAIMFVYISIINFLSWKILKKLNLVKKYSLSSFFADFIFFVVHCFGPILTILKVLSGKNTIENKYKTEK